MENNNVGLMLKDLSRFATMRSIQYSSRFVWSVRPCHSVATQLRDNDGSDGLAKLQPAFQDRKGHERIDDDSLG